MEFLNVGEIEQPSLQKFVIKFPLNDDGEINNSIEATFISENMLKGNY